MLVPKGQGEDTMKAPVQTSARGNILRQAWARFALAVACVGLAWPGCGDDDDATNTGDTADTADTGGTGDTADTDGTGTTGTDTGSDTGDTGDTGDTTDTGAPGPFGGEFLMGSAIAGFQSEMGCPTPGFKGCNDENSDWFKFTTDPQLRALQTDGQGNFDRTVFPFFSGEDPRAVTPGFWELYATDMDLLKSELGGNSLRMSIEWSRIFPNPTDAIETVEDGGYDALKAAADPDMLAGYKAIFEAAKARNITLLVTLNHYALPTWIHDGVTCHFDFANCTARGWVDRERTVREIAKFAGFAAKEFGGYIDNWATLNEPVANVLWGYVQPRIDRTHPPALSLKFTEARTVLHAQIEAHARMYDAIKAHDTVDASGDGKPSFIGLVYPITPAIPKDPGSAVDRKGAKNVDYLYNEVFLKGIALGQWDEKLDGKTTIRDDLTNRLDYLGVNWYFSISVTGTNSATLPAFSPLTTFDVLKLVNLPGDPTLLPETFRYVNEELKVPAIMTENGDPVRADDDEWVPRFFVNNLYWVQKSIESGADVRGYFAWTLIDNYEWNHGMEMKFGLWGIDPTDQTKARFERPGVETLRQIIDAGRVPDDLVTKYVDKK
jgi:beta-galactosidase